MNGPNGMAVVDRLLRAHGLIAPDEVWVHGMWTPDKWLRALKALFCGRKLVRMTHGSLSPVYLEHQGKWKKRLVAPLERWLFSRSERIVTTCAAEASWVRAYLAPDVSRLASKIEILDLRQFFDLPAASPVDAAPSPRPLGSLHVLYLGRRHPLKGVHYLEQAVRDLNRHSPTPTLDSNSGLALRVVSDHTGAELERDWAWCDVLCLPTLSENFGLVVAEALSRGKRVITTDGAPVWDPSVTGTDYGGRLVYLSGFRDGTDANRVRLLSSALAVQ